MVCQHQHLHINRMYVTIHSQHFTRGRNHSSEMTCTVSSGALNSTHSLS